MVDEANGGAATMSAAETTTAGTSAAERTAAKANTAERGVEGGGGRAAGAGPGSGEGGRPGPGQGQLLTGVAWAVLLLGLWLWGSEVTAGVAAQLPATGDVAAVGRPLGQAPQRAHEPVAASDAVRPRRISIGALGVRAAVVESGLDANGEVTVPPATSPALVGWYAGGPQPGAVGAAVMVDESAAAGTGADAAKRTGPDAGKRRGVFQGLSGITPGERVDVRRSDGSTAQFTVEDVRLYDRADFDPRKAYGAHERDRAELRLVTGGGTFDPAQGVYRSKVVVSAYLTGLRPANHQG